MQDATNVENLQNATVYGSDGDKIGSVGQVYLDDRTNEPTFVTVKTGLFGTRETFIPVSQATQTQDGLQVPFDKAFVKDAPNVDADGSITPEEERRIYEYYSLDYAAGPGITGGTFDDTGDAGAGGRRNADTDVDLDRDLNTRGSDPDGGISTTGTGDVGTDRESVVVRDEQLDVGTEVRETGRVRLRKHTYTDTETVEVPVSREEVVVEREPVDPDSAEARGDTGDEEVVVTTREEVPVVDKTATAEKVTVDKNTVRDTERVSATVQHEDVEIEGEGDADRRR
jgi:uncharacterized protein (TIGR02271 family)